MFNIDGLKLIAKGRMFDNDLSRLFVINKQNSRLPDKSNIN
ncbi:hypothetical protein HMPREF9373_2008 [Psychrobacter sp. 1501(2011)]|nr:hypothetical protein HMPREF9373_2008 [Psychrobacter sp. 1501(2011)]